MVESVQHHSETTAHCNWKKHRGPSSKQKSRRLTQLRCASPHKKHAEHFERRRFFFWKTPAEQGWKQNSPYDSTRSCLVKVPESLFHGFLYSHSIMLTQPTPPNGPLPKNRPYLGLINHTSFPYWNESLNSEWGTLGGARLTSHDNM